MNGEPTQAPQAPEGERLTTAELRDIADLGYVAPDVVHAAADHIAALEREMAAAQRREAEAREALHTALGRAAAIRWDGTYRDWICGFCSQSGRGPGEIVHKPSCPEAVIERLRALSAPPSGAARNPRSSSTDSAGRGAQPVESPSGAQGDGAEAAYAPGPAWMEAAYDEYARWAQAGGGNYIGQWPAFCAGYRSASATPPPIGPGDGAQKRGKTGETYRAAVALHNGEATHAAD